MDPLKRLHLNFIHHFPLTTMATASSVIKEKRCCQTGGLPVANDNCADLLCPRKEHAVKGRETKLKKQVLSGQNREAVSKERRKTKNIFSAGVREKNLKNEFVVLRTEVKNKSSTFDFDA